VRRSWGGHRGDCREKEQNRAIKGVGETHDYHEREDVLGRPEDDTGGRNRQFPRSSQRRNSEGVLDLKGLCLDFL
jgi:hypothetical protein